jgi:DNA-binding response OmpR family regulator
MLPADGPLLLVVDDEPDIRELVRVNLEAEGYRVVTANDGEQALSVARDNPPDAVFLDVLMPGRDGWSVLRELKSGDPSLEAVPVIMVTALSQTEDRLRGAIEGAVRYLTKPFHPRELLSVLDELLAPDAPPESELRRRARQDALETLARMESGNEHAPAGEVPRVRLTRLEHGPVREMLPARVSETRDRLETLTAKQRELLVQLRDAGSVSAVAEQIGTSRSNIYASLRRIVHRLGLRDTTELLRLLANEHLLDND